MMIVASKGVIDQHCTLKFEVVKLKYMNLLVAVFGAHDEKGLLRVLAELEQPPCQVPAGVLWSV